MLAVQDSTTAPFAARAVTPAGVAGGRSAPSTVQVNVSSSPSVPSETVTVTLCTPAEPDARVPLITPVAGSIETPAGRPVAE